MIRDHDSCRRPLAAATVAVVAAMLVSAAAVAQDRQPGGPGPGGPGGLGGPGGMMGGPGGMRMGPPPASMTATDRYVYVLRGETLYQFSADGLKLVSKADLPRPEPRGPGPADGKDHQHPRK